MLIYSYNAEQFPIFVICCVHAQRIMRGKTGEIPTFSINKFSPKTVYIFHKQKENICADCKRPQLNFIIHFYTFLLSYRIVIFPGEFFFFNKNLFHCIFISFSYNISFNFLFILLLYIFNVYIT